MKVPTVWGLKDLQRQPQTLGRHTKVALQAAKGHGKIHKKCCLARSLEIAILTGQAHTLSHQSNPER